MASRQFSSSRRSTRWNVLQNSSRLKYCQKKKKDAGSRRDATRWQEHTDHTGHAEGRVSSGHKRRTQRTHAHIEKPRAYTSFSFQSAQTTSWPSSFSLHTKRTGRYSIDKNVNSQEREREDGNPHVPLGDVAANESSSSRDTDAHGDDIENRGQGITRATEPEESAVDDGMAARQPPIVV